jgi:sulfur carrier protein
MIIRVQMGSGGKAMDVVEGSTPQDVLRELKLLPDAHIVIRGREPIPIDEQLSDGQSIRIVKVASGG